jgi:hypothetical protein
MRTLLLGTDFMYNSNGDLVPIEINTNVGMDNIIINDDNMLFNFSELSSFITTKGFINVVYFGSL